MGTRPLFFCLILLSACKSKIPPSRDANHAYYDSIKHLTGLEFDDRIQGADSAVFNFYDNPDGDAKRYTRFYRSYATGDSMILATLARAANRHFDRLEKIRDCRSQGKIFLFENGRPRQTLYFSNRGDTCNHLYFIKDGWFYYMPMDSAAAGLLKDLKANATRME